jgi:glycosidase
MMFGPAETRRKPGDFFGRTAPMHLRPDRTTTSFSWFVRATFRITTTPTSQSSGRTTRAGKYFWTKWLGPDLSGKVVRLPQYNWRSVEFQQYAERVVRFWMDTGLDGMIIDAVNWYVGHTWEQDRHNITDVIRSYGNAYRQPEGGGAFYEDPLGWIQDGGWNFGAGLRPVHLVGDEKRDCHGA